MAKKYLLYIHDERFALETKKSELVNHLLRLHYEGDIVKPGSFKTYDDGAVSYTVNPKFKVIKQEDWDGPLMRDKKKGKL